MKTEEEVGAFERLIVQLQGLYVEMSQLGKKSPNDGLNEFKLRIVNEVLASGNQILKDAYRPFEGFGQFNNDDLPTNSDVTLMLAQYLEQAERLRSDNIAYHTGKWVYLVKGAPSNITTRPPTRISVKK